MYALEFCYKKQLPSSMYLFIYLLVSVWTLGYLFYSIRIIIYFVVQIVPDLASDSPFMQAPLSFDKCPLFFELVLILSKVFRACLVLSRHMASFQTSVVNTFGAEDPGGTPPDFCAH